MGQPIVVTEKPTLRPGTFRFETNRVLTGMAHERYVAGQPIVGERPPDQIALRMFARGGIESVHIYGNVIDVELSDGANSDGLTEIVESLHTYYREGILPAIP